MPEVEHFRNTRTGLVWSANVGELDHTRMVAERGEFERIDPPAPPEPPKRASTRKAPRKTADHDQADEV